MCPFNKMFFTLVTLIVSFITHFVVPRKGVATVAHVRANQFVERLSMAR